MRVLLDEQPPRQLARHFVGHEVRTVQQQAWAGLKNGILLTAAQAAGFQVFVTGDRSLGHQQNLAGRQLGVVVLVAPSNASRSSCLSCPKPCLPSPQCSPVDCCECLPPFPASRSRRRGTAGSR